MSTNTKVGEQDCVKSESARGRTAVQTEFHMKLAGNPRYTIGTHMSLTRTHLAAEKEI
jgi:hypothetical protein